MQDLVILVNIELALVVKLSEKLFVDLLHC